MHRLQSVGSEGRRKLRLHATGPSPDCRLAPLMLVQHPGTCACVLDIYFHEPLRKSFFFFFIENIFDFSLNSVIESKRGHCIIFFYPFITPLHHSDSVYAVIFFAPLIRC